MYYGGSMLADADDVLHPRWCLRLNPTDSADMSAHDYFSALQRTLENSNLYVESFKIDTDDIHQVYKEIHKRLFYFAVNRENPKPVQGPVYVVLAQAPYFKDKYGETIHHQPFSRTEYGMNPMLPNEIPPRHGLRIYTHMIFPMYDTQKQVIDTEVPSFDFKRHYTATMEILNELKVDANMCRLNCLDSTTGLLCGCVNQNEPYVSRCMATNSQNDNVFADHAMLYRINENSRKISSLFSTTYYEDIKI